MKPISDLSIPRLAIYEGQYVAFAETQGKYFWSREHFLQFAGNHQPSATCPLCGGAAVEEGDRWVCAQQSFHPEGRLVDDLDCDWAAPAPAIAVVTVTLSRPVNAEIRIPRGFLVGVATQKEAVVFITNQEIRIPPLSLKGAAIATCAELGTKGNVGQNAVGYVVKPLKIVNCSVEISITRNGSDAPLF